MAFTKDTRQRIINEYLNDTGRNMYIPADFVEYIQERPEHEAYAFIFGKTDKEAAHQYRVDLARDFARGLRIKVEVQETKSKVSSVKVREYPSFISPVENRREGGGYQAFDPNSPEMRAELMRQGITSLTAWIERFGDTFETEGIQIGGIRKVEMEARRVTFPKQIAS